MGIERIERAFETLAEKKKTALVVYVTVGEPSLADTVACASMGCWSKRARGLPRR